MLKVAIVGAGAWGKNLVRTFYQLKDVELAYCCDANSQRRDEVAENYPGVKLTDRIEDVLADASVDAVVVSSSAINRFLSLKSNKYINP